MTIQELANTVMIILVVVGATTYGLYENSKQNKFIAEYSNINVENIKSFEVKKLTLFKSNHFSIIDEADIYSFFKVITEVKYENGKMKKGYDYMFEVIIKTKDDNTFTIDLYNDIGDEDGYVYIKSDKNFYYNYYVEDIYSAISILESRYIEINGAI